VISRLLDDHRHETHPSPLRQEQAAAHGPSLPERGNQEDQREYKGIRSNNLEVEPLSVNSFEHIPRQKMDLSFNAVLVRIQNRKVNASREISVAQISAPGISRAKHNSYDA